MPFNPNLPANGADIGSQELRDQFNALKAISDAQAAQIASLQAQLTNLQNNLNNQIAGTALNPNGQFVNFDPNWSPSGDANTDFIYIRDRITDLYTIEAR